MVVTKTNKKKKFYKKKRNFETRPCFFHKVNRKNKNFHICFKPSAVESVVEKWTKQNTPTQNLPKNNWKQVNKNISEPEVKIWLCSLL